MNTFGNIDGHIGDEKTKHLLVHVCLTFVRHATHLMTREDGTQDEVLFQSP